MTGKNEPRTVRMHHPTGRVKDVTYRNEREMVEYVTLSLTDNGYERRRNIAANAARALLNGPIYIGGAAYEVVEV